MKTSFRVLLGFTLLELIVVIIIVGILASLALPRFLKIIERTRAVEAVNQLKVIREAFERCYLMRMGSNVMSCVTSFQNLDIDDPGSAAGAHFDYNITASAQTLDGSVFVFVTARRNAKDFGAASPPCDVSVNFSDASASTSSPSATMVSLGWHSREGTKYSGCGFYDGMNW